MNVINVRITFQNSPIYILEKFTFKNIDNAYHQFKKFADLYECIILQTCNRVEIFGITKNHDAVNIKKTWSELVDLADRSLYDKFEVSRNNEVYKHVLKLTSGIDSMVIGEEQILHQIKEAINTAKKTSCIGNYLIALFDKALKCGIKIRKNTGINKNGGISIGSVATKMVEENISELRSKKILLIGTGMASTIIAKALKSRKYDFFVASKIINRANIFSKNIGGEPLIFKKDDFMFDKYDVIFIVTSTSSRIIRYSDINKTMKRRTDSIMILDLSNPRAVDENVSTIPNIKLINLDQISEMVYKNIKNKNQKILEVNKMIDSELPILKSHMNRLEAKPIIKEIFRNINRLRLQELQKALKILQEKNNDRIKIMDELTRSVVECILSTPMDNLRKATENGDFEMLENIKKIFDYDKKNAHM